MLKFRTLALIALVPIAACSSAATDDGGDASGGGGGTAGVAGVQQGGTSQGGAMQGGAGPVGGSNPVGGVGPSGGVSGTAGVAGTPAGGASGTGPTGGVSGTDPNGGAAGGPAGAGGTAGSTGGTGAGTGGSSAGTAGAAGMPVNCPAPPTGLIGWATQGGMTTGGGNASPTTITSGSASQLTDGTARVLQFSGTLSGTVEVGSNKTLQGMGSTATINGKISIEGRSNIILRNFRLNAASSDDDGIGIQDSNHIWIDHLEIYDAEDGNMDITDGSDYITVSWTKFRYSSNGDHNFSNLIASDDSDSGNYRITFHHNWWANNVIERMPRVRFGQVHVFNNLYGIGSGAVPNDHCIRAAHEADVRVEANYFDVARTPYEIDEDNGTAVMTATKCAGDTSVGNPASCNIEYLSLNTGGNPTSRGTAFTPPYEYAMTPADCVKAQVSNAQTGAGVN